MEAFILLEFLIIGTICGIFSSTPPGPINLLIADIVLSGKKIKLKSFLTGIILADALFALLAFWGYSTFLEGTDFTFYVSLFGGFVLIILGVVGIYSTFSPKPVKEKPKFAKSTFFVKGMLLMIANPGFLAFWVIVANQIGSFSWHPITNLRTIPLVIGVALGDLIWFILFIRLLRFGKGKMSQLFIPKLRIFISSLLVLIGFYALYKCI